MQISKKFLKGLVSGVVGTLVFLFGFQVYQIAMLYRTFESEMDEGQLRSANLREPPLLSRPKSVDLDWTVTSLTGEDVHLERFRGKTLFLNFWATWCPPCVAEMPAIEELKVQLQGHEVEILCIAEDTEDKVRDFVEKNGYTFPVYLLQGQPPASFDLRSIPVTMVVSPGGEVLLRHVGAADWSDEDFVKALVALATETEPPEKTHSASEQPSEGGEL